MFGVWIKTTEESPHMHVASGGKHKPGRETQSLLLYVGVQQLCGCLACDVTGFVPWMRGHGFGAESRRPWVYDDVCDGAVSHSIATFGYALHWYWLRILFAFAYFKRATPALQLRVRRSLVDGVTDWVAFKRRIAASTGTHYNSRACSTVYGQPSLLVALL